ncbi:N-acylglucosamine 2-epimerase [Zhouia amylolytica]|uniref:N-acylglucosamine 2-epimerase n=2 Tax=Zhouia amylolytica TaxID=376730 RepID=A0A1I6TAW0_9FLAO|nr:N-acylglucosamine 2-epimerase [Zhouia amylolytica]
MFYVIHNKDMKYSEHYKNTLLNDVIPFWERHSVDHKFGGYFTCLDQNGKVYDTDKFIWLQGRQAWMFSMLFNNVEAKEDWLKVAESGVSFLKEKAMDTDGNFYFATTQDGRPLVQPYNIFSDCFAAMAFAQYAKASKDEGYKELARNTYLNILKKKDDPKGKYEKRTGVRPLKGFSLPMILSNLVLELEDVLSQKEVEETIDFSVNEVMNVFLQKDSGLIHENVNPDGSFSDNFEGRLLNPGHGIEAMWFMIDIGSRNGDTQLINKAVQTIITILEYSWDKVFGGIYYFMDVKGNPPQQLEWDQKLWWVHLETLVALAKAYEHTGDQRVLDWYEKVHNYAWSHFADPDNGEWFGYLNRAGKPLLTLKGGKWKGCFHVPRAMFQCWKTFEKIEQSTNFKF